MEIAQELDEERIEVRAQRRRGIWLVLGAALAWSTAGFFTRVVDADLWTMLVWRGGLGAVALFIFMRLRDGPVCWRVLHVARAPFWTAVTLTALAMLAFIAALSLASVAKVSLIYAAAPFAAALLAFLMLGERPSLGALIASLAAAIGIAIMVTPSFRAGTAGGLDGNIYGDVLALSMTFLMALITVHVRRHPDLPMVAVGACGCLLTASMALPFAAPLAVTPHDIFWLAMFGPITSGVGFVLYAKGAQRLLSSEAALLGAIETPLGPLWVWLLFNETPSAPTLLGGGLIFATLLAYVWRENRLGRSK
ncbi:DMT family transporter [Dongia sp.]|uniref:DMT family transporter n=1 Tax=Dongia sp. TaxID=1977262 RepID=UPI0035AE850E